MTLNFYDQSNDQETSLEMGKISLEKGTLPMSPYNDTCNNNSSERNPGFLTHVTIQQRKLSSQSEPVVISDTFNQHPSLKVNLPKSRQTNLKIRGV